VSAATGLIAPFDGTTAGPRAAVQIDAGELEDFQRTARLLLGHPLVTPTWPNPRALTTVRRWEVPLRNEFSRVLGFRLDVGRSSARLYRRAATTSVHRGPFTRTLRPLGHVACSFLCLVLAALEELGDQTLRPAWPKPCCACVRGTTPCRLTSPRTRSEGRSSTR
jgi:hypothetical protein